MLISVLAIFAFSSERIAIRHDTLYPSQLMSSSWREKEARLLSRRIAVK
jgi:hypothetical protein